MKKIVKNIICTTLALFIGITTLQVTLDDRFKVSAQSVGNYYNQILNTESSQTQTSSNENTVDEVDLNSVQRSPYESLLIEGYQEDISRREESIKVFVKEDQEKTLYFLEPVHEWKDNQWHDIDLDFKVSASRSVSIQKSETQLRRIEVREKEVSLSDYDGHLISFSSNQERAIESTYDGLIAPYQLGEDTPFEFTVGSDIEAQLNPSKTSIQLLRNNEVAGTLKLTYLDEEFTHTAAQAELSLTKVDQGYQLKATPFGAVYNIDVEVAVTTSYDSSVVKLFGFRSGSIYKDHSYNPGGYNDMDNVVIGNGDYNDGYIFCAGMCSVESKINYGMISFYNNQSLSGIIGTNRTVSAAKLVLYYNTHVNANDGQGAILETLMLDPSKNFDTDNPNNLTYVNLQNYLNTSSTQVMGSSTISGGYEGQVTFDISSILQSWENSGNHHAILIKAESKANGTPIEAAHYFANHVSNIYPDQRPYIEITTVKNEPISSDYDINQTTLQLRPFTVSDRSLNVVYFSALGFDGLAKPGAMVNVKVESAGGVSVYNQMQLTLDGYRRYPHFDESLYGLLTGVQQYYRLTSNYQMLSTLKQSQLSFNTLYKVSYQSTYNASTTAWKASDEFLIYKVTAYDRLSRILQFYGINDKVQFMQDNHMSDELLVEGNVLFIRNPTKNKDKVYQSVALSDNDKRIIDQNLLGRNQHCIYGYEPINFNTGNFIYSNPDMGSIDYDQSVVFERYYNSMGLQKVGLFGRNWNLSLYKELFFLANGNIELSDGTGRIYTFIKDGANYKTPFDSNYSISTYEISRETIWVDSGYYDQEGTPVREQQTIIKKGYTIKNPMTSEVMVFDEVGNILSYQENQYTLAYQYTYQNGNLKTIMTPAGRVFTFELNELGLVKTITDPSGAKVNYGYDSDMNLIKFVDQAGYSINYRYDGNSRMLSYTGRESGDQVILNTYDSLGRIDSQTDALGNTAHFSYGTGYSEITDHQGMVSRIEVDGKGYTSEVMVDQQSEAVYNYDAQGNLTQIIYPDGREKSYVYNQNQQLTKETDTLGQVKQYSYDSAGNLVSMTDTSGDISTFVYDSFNRLVESHYSDGTSEIKQYNVNHQVSYQKDIYGLEKWFTYLQGNLIEVTYSDGSSQKYQYNALGYNTKFIDESGVSITYVYDARGLETRKIYGQYQIETIYNGDGEMVSQIDGNGHRVNYFYDGWSRLIERTDGSGSTYYRYDEAGNVIEVENALGIKTTYEYDALNQLISSRDGAGRVSEYQYNSYHQLVKTIQPNGDETIRTYNALEQVVSEQFLDQVKTYEYNTLGQLIKFTEASGDVYEYAYNEVGQLIESKHLGEITLYRYQGSRLVWKSVNGLESMYEYNLRGQVIESTDPLQRVNTQTYMANQQIHLSSIGDITLEHAYNQEGLLANEKDGLGYQKQYHYDGNGNVIEVIDENGQKTSYEYNHQNKMTKMTSPEGYVTTYEYDVVGQLIKTRQYDLINNDVAINSYEYDEVGQLIRSVDAINRETVYTYDVSGQLIEKNQWGVIETYHYDAYGRLIESVLTDRSVYYHYDQKGNMISQEDTLGYRSDYTYNEKNQLVSKENGLGQIETYTYNQYGHRISMEDAWGRVSTYEYNVLGELVSTTDAFGIVKEYTYNNRGVVTQMDSEGLWEKTTLDARGYVSVIENNKGVLKAYSYDGAGQILSESVNGQVQTSFVYDGEGRVIESIDALGQSTAYRYNQWNQVVEIHYPDGTLEQSLYDLAGRRVLSVDALGFETHYEYNDKDELIKQTDALGASIIYTYDEMGRLVLQEEELSKITSYRYDERGRLVEEVSPNQNKTVYTYTDFDEIETIIMANGLVMRYAYNQDQQLIQEGYEGSEDQTYYTYNSLGLLIMSEDGQGNVVSLLYDKFGNTSEIKANQLSESNEYDLFGRLIKHVDRRGYTVNYTYNEFDQVIMKEDSEGFVERYEYDILGRQVKRETELGVEETVYDERSRVIERIDVLGYSTNYVYDQRGNLLSTTDPLGLSTHQKYDEVGRVVEITDEKGKVTSYQYDALGRKEKSMDDEGVVLTYHYDLEGNLLETNYKDELIEKRQYDETNRVVTIEQRGEMVNRYDYDLYGNLIYENINGVKTSYTYDEYHQMIEKSTSDSSITYHYNTQGQLVEAVQDGLSVILTMNEYGDIAQVEDSLGHTVSYRYDQKGRKQALIYADGREVIYHYDVFDRLIQVDDGDESVRYKYDGKGNLIYEENQELKVTRSYDAKSNLLEQVTVQGEVELSRLTYVRDEQGNVLMETSVLEEKTTVKEYVYDQDNQIIEEKVTDDDGVETTSLVYDRYGNKTRMTLANEEGVSSTRYLYNEKNQLIEVISGKEKINLTYDDYGNLIEKVSTKGIVETYEYNKQNQLIRIYDHLGHEIEYQYDALGERISKKETKPYDYLITLQAESVEYDTTIEEVDISALIQKAKEATAASLEEPEVCTITYGEKATEIVEETYINDINLEYSELLSVVVEGEVSEQYYYGMSRYKEEVHESKSYTILNEKYDMMGLVSEKEVVWNTYELFGARSTTTTSSRFGYSNEAQEGDLQYLRARYYDSGLGIFMSPDTYLGNGSNVLSKNRYLYTENNPVNTIDPSGNVGLALGKKPSLISPKKLPQLSQEKLVQATTSTSSSVGAKVGLAGGVKLPEQKQVIKDPKASEPSTGARPKYPGQDISSKVKIGEGDFQNQLTEMTTEWKTQGMSEKEIETKKLDLITKYCDSKNGSLWSSPSSATYDPNLNPVQPRKGLIEDFFGFVEENLGTILTAVAIISLATGFGFLGVAAMQALAALGVTSAAATMTASAAAALVAKSALAGMATSLALTLKSLLGHEMNALDWVSLIGSIVLQLGVGVVYNMIALGAMGNGFVEEPTRIPQPGDEDFIGPLEKEGTGSTSWYNEDGSINYPPNDGAVPGSEKSVTLQPGDTVGRYGEIGPDSKYVTQAGASADSLSLPPNTDQNIYQNLKVLQPIEGVIESIVAPWGGSSGGGIQYVLPKAIQWYIDNGFIGN